MSNINKQISNLRLPATWISIASVIIVFAFSTVSTIREKKRDYRDYDEKSLLFQPKLKVIPESTIGFARLIIDTAKLKKMPPDIIFSDTHEIPCSLQIISKLKIANIGNYTAKVYASFWGDFPSGDLLIRDNLLKRNQKKLNLIKCSQDNYYKTKQIAPDDTITIEYKHTIQFMLNNEFTLHYFILYTNEIGAFYDTYFWARYQAKEPVEKAKGIIILYKRALVEGLEIRPRPPLEYLKFIDSNTSHSAYSLSESKILKGNIEAVLNDSIKEVFP